MAKPDHTANLPPGATRRTRTRRRTARRREKLRCTTAGGVDARIISPQVDSITRACARDYDGVQIKRQLNGFGVRFALTVESIALGLRADGSFARSWAHPMARRLATDMIFLGYESKEQTFKGKTVWCICGFSVRCIGMQSTVRFCANAIYDGEGKPKGASINTLSRDLARLRAGGFLLPEEKPHSHQYDAKKLIAQGKGWAVGPPKKNPDGSPMLDKNGEQMQFALNHYYIPFSPFAPGTRGRVKPGKFDHPFRSKQSTGEHPTPAGASTPDGRVEDAKDYARGQADARIARMMAANDAKRPAVTEPRRHDRPRPSLPKARTLPAWEDPARIARLMALSDSDPPGHEHS